MTHSWEIGTLAEALTEFEWPSLAVFAPGSIPPPPNLGEDKAADVLSIAEKCALFRFPNFPSWVWVRIYAYTAGWRFHAASLRKSLLIPFHSLVVTVQ
jgi:hypothetical protein